jgi:hypothetical protein
MVLPELTGIPVIVNLASPFLFSTSFSSLNETMPTLREWIKIRITLAFRRIRKDSIALMGGTVKSGFSIPGAIVTDETKITPTCRRRKRKPTLIIFEHV